MIRAFDAFSLPLLRWFDPEDAHRLAIQGLRLLPPVRPRPDDPKLAVRAFGLNFPNPIGMAAGFDKSAEAPGRAAAARLRLCRDRHGDAEAASRQSAAAAVPAASATKPSSTAWASTMTAPTRCCGGSRRARIAAASSASMSAPTRIRADRVADYVRLIETFAPVASYFTVNVSSPNTPGLRNLQQAAALDDLLAKVIDARERVRQNAGDSPVLLKIAPDLSLAELDDVVHIARSRRVDGMIVANTTLARPATLREQNRAKEQGGLSGRPLFRLSTRMVAETYVRAEARFRSSASAASTPAAPR